MSAGKEITDFVIPGGASSEREGGHCRKYARVLVRIGGALSTILVVDDDPGTRSLLRLILETAGHVVLDAPHGKAALEIIQPDALPDVVVTDLMMPVLSGAELIEWLHSEQRTAAIPIVLVSASSDAAQTLQASGLVQAVVRKPFDVYALVECIESVATRRDEERSDPGQLAV